MAFLLAFGLLIAAASARVAEPPLSLAPLFTTLVEDVTEDVIARPNRRSRRLALTADNTEPIRLRVDASSLHESTALQYTTCFNVGDWFRRGLPTAQVPPSDGVPTCIRDNNEYLSAADGCWGLCASGDIVSPTTAQLLEDTVTAISAEMGGFFSIQTPAENIIFSVDKGRYQRALIEKGYTPTDKCAADCQVNGPVLIVYTPYVQTHDAFATH